MGPDTILKLIENNWYRKEMSELKQEILFTPETNIDFLFAFGTLFISSLFWAHSHMSGFDTILRWTLFVRCTVWCCESLIKMTKWQNERTNIQSKQWFPFLSIVFDTYFLTICILFWWLLTCFVFDWLQIYHGIGCANCLKMWLVFHFLKHCSCTTTHCVPYPNRSEDYIRCRFWIWGK